MPEEDDGRSGAGLQGGGGSCSWSRVANPDLLSTAQHHCRAREQEEANLDGTGAGDPGKAYPLGGKASQDTWDKGVHQPYPPHIYIPIPPTPTMANAIGPAQANVVDPTMGEQFGPPINLYAQHYNGGQYSVWQDWDMGSLNTQSSQMFYGPSFQGGKFGGKNCFSSSHRHDSLGKGKGKNSDSSQYQGQNHSDVGGGVDGCGTSTAPPTISSHVFETGKLPRVIRISQFLNEPGFLDSKTRLGYGFGIKEEAQDGDAGKPALDHFSKVVAHTAGFSAPPTYAVKVAQNLKE